MTSADVGKVRLAVEVPGDDHHAGLVSCQAACPVHTDARGYVRAVAEGRYEEAYLIARGPNPLASVCGRICGAPCETACRRGKIPRTDADGAFVALDRPVAIRALKRFACEQAGPDAWRRIDRRALSACSDAEEMAALLRAFSGPLERVDGVSVGIVGGGPAGLAAAHDLALMGFKPVVYDLEPVPGGMLAVGIPAYRLPRDLVRQEVEVIRALGAEFRCGVAVGRDVSFAELRRRHRAVLLAVGAKRSRSLGLPGETGPGVLGGVDLLRAVALGEPASLGSDVLVVGGGNVAYDVARTVVRQAAYDAARTAKRLAAVRRVRLVSLETLEEMPADTLEIREGDEEGIERLNGWGPVEVLRGPDGRVTGVAVRRCVRVYDAERRFSPVFDDADRRRIDCNTVLVAAGQSPDLSFLEDGGKDVEMLRPGWPKVDRETLRTTADGVFAAGDLAHGTRLVIDAVASGKKAARAIYAWVTGRRLEPERLTAHLPLDDYGRERGYEAIRRQEIPTLDPAWRLKAGEGPVELGFQPREARLEASRCLDCGVAPVFDGARCVLCGGCADVCPTLCLKLAAVEDLDGPVPEGGESAILKDEDRCIRCALCEQRCPADAIAMERVQFQVDWRPA